MRALGYLLFVPLLSACHFFRQAQDVANIRPGWIAKPELEGRIGVVGFAPRKENQNLEDQYRIALVMAQAQLSEIYNVQVRSTSIRSGIQDGGRSVTKELSNDKFTTASVIQMGDVTVKEWIDRKTKGLYVLLVVQ